MFQLVLLRIPDFRDRNFRIFKPILKKGFECDPDLSDPNPQMPQKKIRDSSYDSRRTDKRAKKHYKQQIKKLCQKLPKFAKFQAILGAFYLATKIRILALKIRIFFLPQKRAKESDLGIPIPGSVTTLVSTTTTTLAAIHAGNNTLTTTHDSHGEKNDLIATHAMPARLDSITCL
jgi:hypothetical protein